MGKNSNKMKENGKEHSNLTIFVSNLPYSFSNTQLEETFSEVGPVRRCFMVTQKGSAQHRGFGYVQLCDRSFTSIRICDLDFSSLELIAAIFSAVEEDAIRAIELKNGSSVGGRKIAVKHAMPRPTREERQSKPNQVGKTDDNTESKNDDKDGTPSEADKHVSVSKEDVQVSNKQRTSKKPIEVRKANLCNDIPDEGGCSEKQRVARTIIFGGLKNSDMAEDVHRQAKEIGTVCSIKYPLPRKDLDHDKIFTFVFYFLQSDVKDGRHNIGIFPGLLQDGCVLEASAVLYTSVKLARAAVASLHKKEIGGGTVWARQLGGEGSKTQKWKLIVRNLPFKAREDEIRDIFASAGYVWDVFIPRKSDTGLSKGFAFVKFTCKQDAENVRTTTKAIQKLNGFTFSKRLIAVDWAVPKKIFNSDANAALASEEANAYLLGYITFLLGGSIEIESKYFPILFLTQINWSLVAELLQNYLISCVTADIYLTFEVSDHCVLCYTRQQKVNDEDGSATESDGDDSDIDSSSAMEEDGAPSEINFEKEAGIARKVLNNLITSSTKGTSVNNDSVLGGNEEPKSNEIVKDADNKSSGETEKVSDVSKPEISDKSKLQIPKQAEEADLQRTIFINNLPFECDNEEVKQRFSGFGEVEYFAPVLHQVTKRPRGTGFLKFKTVEAADAAISAASAASGVGILLKGRPLKVLKALDKKSAQDKEVEKAKNEVQDHRNLYLAKEGLILEGTPAAEGVSSSDMLKRQDLEKKKKTKLQSPNFHVSTTRLIIYNLPKTMTEKQLKKLCIDAVKSKATKQKPFIRQIKFLKDGRKGNAVPERYSRGVAFVEFSEHQHALVALRVLNNNPETFNPEHRPIVEFALDNVQTLKLRKEKLQYQQQALDVDNDGKENGEPGKELDHMHTKDRKRKYQEHGKSAGKESAVNTNSEPGGTVASEKSPEGNKFKSQKGNHKNKSAEESSLKQNSDALSRKPRNEKGGQNHGNTSHEAQNTTIDANRIKAGNKVDVGFRKRKMQNQEDAVQDVSRKRTKKKKAPVGKEAVDKLDMLIEQYRSKFSHKGSQGNDGDKKPSKQLRKWFES
ncbi:hypothetical protein Lal_00029362 [Lupinus albus]|nr:hypothetical protein Lal_00029362 [Lupinus albus]